MEDEHDGRPPHERGGEALNAIDWTEGVEIERDASVAAAISNAMVGLKKGYFGKGPRKAQTFLHGPHVITVLHGGLLRHEETLLAAGHVDAVRSNRLLFQNVMAQPTTQAVEQITGRPVLSYQSQIAFDPTITWELFLLG